MTLRCYVPRDATADALGAHAVAAAIEAEAAARGIASEIIRTGSRGAFWLEPLVEVDAEGGRRAWGTVTVDDVPGLFDAGFPRATHHPLHLGDADRHPWFARQQRLSFRRAGLTDPVSLEHYRDHGGLRGLERALTLAPQAIIDAIKASGLRGRGGAAFPTGIKWQTVHDAPAEQRYICCNADEGDSGTFADRLLLEADPFQLIEGMIIAGLAVGATKGYVYLRSEYPAAYTVVAQALATARTAGLLGDVLGSGKTFTIELRRGAGSYVCGEETAMLESLEGRRGMVRPKPPLPAIEGLFGQPTVVNNVLTLAAATTILADGPEAYRQAGSERSGGTLTVQLAGNVRRGGVVEVPFGTSLRTLLEQFGGGTSSGRPMRAVQVGGPLGTYLPEAHWDTPLDYEALGEIGGLLGHGGVVVFDDTVDLAEQARFALAFCAEESCGKCTPCRLGSMRGVALVDRIRRGDDRAGARALLGELCETMEAGSLCAMGGLTPYPVRSAIEHFPEDFERPPA